MLESATAALTLTGSSLSDMQLNIPMTAC